MGICTDTYAQGAEFQRMFCEKEMVRYSFSIIQSEEAEDRLTCMWLECSDADAGILEKAGDLLLSHASSDGPNGAAKQDLLPVPGANF